MEPQFHHQPTDLVQQPPLLHFSPSTTTTTTTDVNPNLPSYSEMITAAILWDSSQGKAGGSSKRAIAKYIDRVYQNLPPSHSSLLNLHLKKMKNNGQLVMINCSYQLPILAASATATATVDSKANVKADDAKYNDNDNDNDDVFPVPVPVPIRSVSQSVEVEGDVYEGGGGEAVASVTPKRRGRPPKIHSQPQLQLDPQPQSAENLNLNLNSNSVGVGNGSSTGKKRGRPPKIVNKSEVVAEVPFVQAQAEPGNADLGLNNGLSPPPSQSQSAKRRGRPPKKPVAEVAAAERVVQFQPVNEGTTTYVIGSDNGTIQKKRPGRPPRAAAVASAAATAALNEGDSAGEVVVGEGGGGGGAKPKGRGRGRPKRSALGPAAKRIGKKPRGRPPRVPGLVVAPLVRKKRPGRPKKGSGSVVPIAAKPLRMYTGKPRGRPKKSALTPAKPTPRQQKVDEELIKKVENVQLTLKDAVGVLKPYFTNVNATDALTALQQLEDLSTMDVFAPSLNPPVEPPVTSTMLDNATVQPLTSVPSLESIIPPVAPVSTIPAPQPLASSLPPVMPFNLSAPPMTDTTPFYMHPNGQHWNSTAN